MHKVILASDAAHAHLLHHERDILQGPCSLSIEEEAGLDGGCDEDSFLDGLLEGVDRQALDERRRKLIPIGYCSWDKAVFVCVTS
jgi:hypothetical protein